MFSRLFVSSLFSVIAVTAAVNEMSHPECKRVLQDWLDTSQPDLDVPTASLTFPWRRLRDRLAEASCLSDSDGDPAPLVRAELWRVIVDDLGTPDYFKKYTGCDLSPDHFALNEATVFPTRNGTASVPFFRHVVETKYLLRVCPCAAEERCTSECRSSNSHCGKVVEVAGSGKVFKWCTDKGKAKLRRNEAGGVKMEVLPSRVNCTSASIVGMLASCTPVQPSYDRVKVVLHRVSSEKECTRGGNDAAASTGSGGGDGIRPTVEPKTTVVYGRMTVLNETHGNFDVTVGDLAPNSVYCASVELADHPYCRAHIFAGEGQSGMPGVCFKYTLAPLKTDSDSTCVTGQER